jgi:hypothetical protein
VTAQLPLLEGDHLIVDHQHRHLARYAWRLDKRGLAYRLGWSEEGEGFFTVRHLHEDVLGVRGKSTLVFLNGDRFDYRAANLDAYREDGTRITLSRTVPASVHPTGERRRVRVNP